MMSNLKYIETFVYPNLKEIISKSIEPIWNDAKADEILLEQSNLATLQVENHYTLEGQQIYYYYNTVGKQIKEPINNDKTYYISLTRSERRVLVLAGGTKAKDRNLNIWMKIFYNHLFNNQDLIYPDIDEDLYS